MTSVTRRIRQIKQPWGGYIRPKEFTVVNFNDNVELNPEENIHSSLVGLAVDYLTSYSMGTPPKDAFKYSLTGAYLIDETDYAQQLLNQIGHQDNGKPKHDLLEKIWPHRPRWLRLRGRQRLPDDRHAVGPQITRLDDKSITNACKLTGYDVCYRAGGWGYQPVQDIAPDPATIFNIKTMVNRGVTFMNQYGPMVKDRFTFEGGYTDIVTAGDGDFLTEDTLWDFKVSKKPPTNAHTLQLLMYYIMGQHSIHEEFKSIKKLGIFNPRLNKVYTLDVSSISPDIISDVTSNVIGYKNQ